YRLDRVFSNQEIKELVVAIGAGVGETFDESKMRYHKVILMNDADVDGEHITTLMLTFFFRHMKEIIKKGYLYVAQPPLFRVETTGNESFWVIDEEAREQKIQELKTARKEIKNVQRFKGLGEMQPVQLWDTTMNPDTRVLKKINIEDAEEADRTFDMLMGAEVGPRKKFIQTYSKTAELDI
ncbi:MAG: gyrase subunit B protein, partial [candidate division WS6 bacterium GW2011_GWA2_37_6]